MSVISSTLFVTDLDGTLLNDCSRVSPSSAALLNELSRRGAAITVATARTPATVSRLLDGIHLNPPLIVMTGAATWQPRGNVYTDLSPMLPATASHVLDVCRSHGVEPFVYSLGADGIIHVSHPGAMSPGEKRFVDERRHLPLKRFHLGLERAPEGDVALLFAMGPRDNIFAVADLLRVNVDCSVSAYVDIFGRDTGILEVFAPGVSKAAAITRLAARLGKSRTVVFGDNLNDIPMMTTATEAYAVGNALDEVKAVATEVIGTNLTDAVATTISRLCGI